MEWNVTKYITNRTRYIYNAMHRWLGCAVINEPLPTMLALMATMSETGPET